MKDIRTVMYIMVGRNGRGDISTLQHRRTDCISEFLKGSTLSWNEAKKYGWKCKAVDVQISPTSNID